MDEELSWEKHIERLGWKRSPQIGILLKTRNFVSRKYILNVYLCLNNSNLQNIESIRGATNRSILKPRKKITIKQMYYKMSQLETTENLYKDEATILNITSLLATTSNIIYFLCTNIFFYFATLLLQLLPISM